MLAATLRAFEQLQTKELDEVIVVDDHSDQAVSIGIRSMLENSSLRSRFFVNSGTGPAAARNLGIRKARSPILLFYGDDMVPHENLMDKHIQFHHTHPEPEKALVGFITWSENLPVTPFMRWLEDGGPQFGYPASETLCTTTYLYFYSSNLSLKKEYLCNSGVFDEEFPYASYEDIELAYRLSKKHGLSLYYDPCAVAYHNHPTTFFQGKQRMERVGYSARILTRKHPELTSLFDFMNTIVNARVKNSIRMLFYPIGYLFKSERILHAFYWQIMAKHFMIGYHGTADHVPS